MYTSNVKTSVSSADKKSKINKLREKHQPIFDELGVDQAVFIPKMAYRPKGKEEKYVSFFTSEIKKGGDIYTEFVSREYESEDSERTLWKWRFNPHWQEEYEVTEETDPSKVRYLVPVSELIKMSSAKVPTSYSAKEKEVEDGPASYDPHYDEEISAMTMRDFAAIVLGKPVSNKTWLNKLIKGNE